MPTPTRARSVTLEDLGVAARGDLMVPIRVIRHPRTGAEVLLLALTRGGIWLVDPKNQTSEQIKPDRAFACGETATQTPDGRIFQCDYGTLTGSHLVMWDGHAAQAKTIAQTPAKSVMGMDAGADGGVYVADYASNRLYRVDLTPGKVEDFGDFNEFGEHLGTVIGGRDGWLYLRVATHLPDAGIRAAAVAFHPGTRERTLIGPMKSMFRDAAGTVVAELNDQPVLQELRDGKTHAIEKSRLRLAPNGRPWVFSDGGYIEAIADLDFTYVDASGNRSTFTAQREGSPLRIFSIESGGGKIWCGTFMPLSLSSYDIQTGAAVDYGNPSKTEGEPYGMVFAENKLFLACYTAAHLVRFDPAKPFQKKHPTDPNPKTLGPMKPDGLPLQRPYGKAVDAKGNMYFAARGDYGCEDSGITRIDPRTEAVTRWIYPATTFGSMIYMKEADQLVVTEQRRGDSRTRLTTISASDGTIVASVPVFPQGEIHSLLAGDNGVIYGLHGRTATFFVYDVRKQSTTARLDEMRVGDHTFNALVHGPPGDGRIWGLTTRAIYAVPPDASGVEVIASYDDHAGGSVNRFGLCYGEDGHLYFHSGTNLFRLRIG